MIEPDYGRRLVVDIVDELATREPERPYIHVPRSSRPQDGWAPVTFKQLANAVNHVAYIVARDVKPQSDDAFPTLAYVGPNDVRYAVVMLACIKAGCQSFFISPRNSVEGQHKLLKATNCRHAWYAESFEFLVKPWSQMQLQTSVVPSADEWLAAEGPPFPYARPFDEARFEPLCVLHTSGSTGTPKPIIVRQGSVAVADWHRQLPDYQGAPPMIAEWARRCRRVLMPMPLFHAAGMVTFSTIMAIFYQLPLALGTPDQPLTSDLVEKYLAHAGADSVLLPPSVLEELAHSQDGLEALRRLTHVIYGGGNLSSAAGDRLVEHGVSLCNHIGSTEVVPYGLYAQRRPELWQYLVFHNGLMGADWRLFNEEDGTYELVLRRASLKDPGSLPAFYTFPDRVEWSTGDLYKAHPSLPDHWRYCGRSDDVIVFSNGEKLNPVSMEAAMTGDAAVKGAVVVGQDRFRPALILEPVTMPESEADKEALIDRLWPLVEEANRAAVAHGRVVRQLVTLSDPALPFVRTPKGTVQRASTVRRYGEHIKSMYGRADELEAQEAPALNFCCAPALTLSIVDMIEAKLDVALRPDTDFFAVGIDSLQMMRLANMLRGSCAAAGVEVGSHLGRAMYAHPTPRALAEHVLSAAKRAAAGGDEDDEGQLRVLREVVARYTDDLPTPAAKPDPLDDGQTVVVTGTTGSLGAYLLDGLCRLPSVKRIVALNRGDDAALRQGTLGEARGLGSDFAKVEFLSADLSAQDLGLGKAKYDELLASADRVIHNAWPVNFNISLASFEPHIRGVRHLVDLSSRAARRVPIIFVSSISTAGGWRAAEPVPEARLEDLSLASMGYGRSKLAGSLILDAAASRGVPGATVRVGQIAGPRGRGMWNKHEFVPSLIASSVYLGRLPESIGPGDEVDWLPVEDVASLVLDVAGVTRRVPVAAIDGYFHCVNPTAAAWGELSTALARHYGLELVPLEEWVAALERSAGAAEVARNPAVKLLDTYRQMLAAARQGVGHVRFAMQRTMGRSPRVAKLGPITPELLRHWCEQWAFAGAVSAGGKPGDKTKTPTGKPSPERVSKRGRSVVDGRGGAKRKTAGGGRWCGERAAWRAADRRPTNWQRGPELGAGL